jgi:carbonic anhydrase/acetyltransferase-like protein (isoleucine patch superfamily)
MDGCILEDNAMLAAGAMLTPGKRIDSFQMWGGRPARFMRDLDENWAMMNQMAVAHYVQNGQAHKAAISG